MRDALSRTVPLLAAAVLSACGSNGGGNPPADSGPGYTGPSGTTGDGGNPGGGPSPNCPSDYASVDAVLHAQPTCILDHDCSVETLSCSLLGQCWAIVSPTYESALNMDIEQLSTDQCTYTGTGACTCPPEPAQAELKCSIPSGASQGVCVQVSPDGGTGDAGSGS
jgi:hypothetical protein